MYPGRMAVEDRIPESVRRELEDRGHEVLVEGAWTLGATSAIVREDGMLSVAPILVGTATLSRGEC